MLTSEPLLGWSAQHNSSSSSLCFDIFGRQQRSSEGWLFFWIDMHTLVIGCWPGALRFGCSGTHQAHSFGEYICNLFFLFRICIWSATNRRSVETKREIHQGFSRSWCDQFRWNWNWFFGCQKIDEFMTVFNPMGLENRLCRYLFS